MNVPMRKICYEYTLSKLPVCSVYMERCRLLSVRRVILISRVIFRFGIYSCCLHMQSTVSPWHILKSRGSSPFMRDTSVLHALSKSETCTLYHMVLVDMLPFQSTSLYWPELHPLPRIFEAYSTLHRRESGDLSLLPWSSVLLKLKAIQ